MSVGVDESKPMEATRDGSLSAEIQKAHQGTQPEGQPLPVQDALSASAKTISEIEALGGSSTDARARGDGPSRPVVPGSSTETAVDRSQDNTRSAENSTAINGGRYLPRMLTKESQSFDEVRKLLEQIVVSKMSEAASESRYAGAQALTLRPLDTLGNAVVSAHALAAYASTLDIGTLRKLTAHVVADTGFWLARTFRFHDSCMFCHDESREGLIRVVQMLLHLKYDKYAVDAYQTLYSKPPCIYVGQAAEQETAPGRASVGHALCAALGLPRACLRVIPSLNNSTGFNKMNISILERQMEQDLNKGCVPLIVLAQAGTGQCGQKEHFERLFQLCQERNLWLHVEGHSLAALALGAETNTQLRCADSMTLPVGSWLGVPSLPYVTLYRQHNSALAHAAGLTLFNIHSKLHCLPLWATLQCLGQKGLFDRIAHCFKQSDLLVTTLESIGPCIEIIGRSRFAAVGSNASTEDHISVVERAARATNPVALFDAVQPIVTFRFRQTFPSAADASSDYSNTDNEKGMQLSESYMNNLNLWLGQMVNREVPQVTIELTEVEGHGICVKFSPLESAHLQGTTMCDMENFCKTLEGHVAILSAMVVHKKKFHRLLAGDHHEFGRYLELVEISDWAGLGGVRYIPEAWATTPASVDQLKGKREAANSTISKTVPMSESDRDLINQVNQQLVARLRASDSAFSLGEGANGLVCIRFGMVTEDLAVEELLHMVLAAGRELEESCKQLEEMSELVRQAVEEANAALERENEERIYQEGLLKHVPIFGSLLQWWSPPSDEGAGIKGRSFNLTSGMVETTENTYKYHMQMKSEAPAPNTPPPQQQIQIQTGSGAGIAQRGSQRS
ncbi:putative pyridoxal-dependent decarboxylase domain-containing protein 2 isoform X3 [Varroa jacobsoni]|uniref:Pyridoxal-dependent decarboxylase domain-containing protein 1 n=1 Tax=Varroa destructor TaxID=109461 RepID=A0A7M7J5D6_VARDE|nr:putative pyridoxal-dependent decarboxylase domain-containing protein 2 isoform X3 [Varroa destructor]XP_022695688.1 putative pyridoxal-dependent decarboxylase domain-containing protein 2 isoform X3 [Varroa jacobsoni]